MGLAISRRALIGERTVVEPPTAANKDPLGPFLVRSGQQSGKPWWKILMLVERPVLLIGEGEKGEFVAPIHQRSFNFVGNVVVAKTVAADRDQALVGDVQGIPERGKSGQKRLSPCDGVLGGGRIDEEISGARRWIDAIFPEAHNHVVLVFEPVN